MGRNLRVQARLNHRAAVMELRPGLYLVADVASEALLPTTSGEDIGMVLPGLMVKAASKVFQNRRERRGALDALQPRQLPGPAPAPSPSPLQLYGMEWSEG